MMIAATRDDRCRTEPAPPVLRRARGRPGLSRDEEHELAGRIACGDRTARDELVQANLGLVVAIARRFLGRGLDLDDLVGEGNLGLIRAAEEFDPRFGARFSTYAVCWIRQAIREALTHRASTIRVPEHMVGLLAKWRRAERAIGRELGRAPCFEEIAASLGLSDARKALVSQALVAGRLLLESNIRSGPGDGLSVTVMDRHARAEEGVEAEEERAVAWRLMGRLDDRERTIVMLRFGLEGEPLTLEEIGCRLGVTRERVRQIEAGALLKLGNGRPDQASDPYRDPKSASRRPVRPRPGSPPPWGKP
jgi:RNA polymerase primary sigma factor